MSPTPTSIGEPAGAKRSIKKVAWRRAAGFGFTAFGEFLESDALGWFEVPRPMIEPTLRVLRLGNTLIAGAADGSPHLPCT
jgi:hypothetical protein